MALSREQEKKLVHGKFYLVLFQQQASMPPRWEPAETYRKDGQIYFKTIGVSQKLYTGDVSDIIEEPIPLPTTKGKETK